MGTPRLAEGVGFVAAINNGNRNTLSSKMLKEEQSKRSHPVKAKSNSYMCAANVTRAGSPSPVKLHVRTADELKIVIISHVSVAMAT